MPKQTPKCVFRKFKKMVCVVEFDYLFLAAKGMSVVTSKPVTSYNQTSGSIIKTGGSRRVIEVPDEGEDEEIEETETIITKKTIRKKVKSKQVYVSGFSIISDTRFILYFHRQLMRMNSSSKRRVFTPCT